MQKFGEDKEYRERHEDREVWEVVGGGQGHQSPSAPNKFNGKGHTTPLSENRS